MFSIDTASGTVRAAATEPDPSGAVRYALTGAVTGTVHVVASHDPRQWDDFRALRISLGSENGIHALPSEPLPRIRGRAYTGVMTRRLAVPADAGDGCFINGRLADSAERDAPPQASTTLHTVMRSCGEHYAARRDLPKLQRLARWRETPKLCAWLESMITTDQAHISRAEREAQQHRRAARMCIKGWWFLARLFTEQPSPLLAYLLGNHPDSLAHRAHCLPLWADISAQSAIDTRRRLDHLLTEREGLRHCGRPPSHTASCAPPAC
ncbi:hypothetical protein ACFWXK_10205 [Streptomyces sp. NPDC059070]|uniref:hypothetical protein n=1 Tax=Streptomyces sp. NPDC059070 TaxID=3346713 RepID=UPI0036C6C859